MSNSGHAWRRGTGSGKSAVRNDWSTVPKAATESTETPRFVRRQRYINDLQQKQRLLQQQLAMVDDKVQLAGRVLERKIAEKVPDQFHADQEAMMKTTQPQSQSQSAAAQSAEVDRLANLLEASQGPKVEEEQIESIASARIRNIAETGYTLEVMEANHSKLPPPRLQDAKVIRPGSSLDDLRVLAKVRETRRGISAGAFALSPAQSQPAFFGDGARGRPASQGGGGGSEGGTGRRRPGTASAALAGGGVAVVAKGPHLPGSGGGGRSGGGGPPTLDRAGWAPLHWCNNLRHTKPGGAPPGHPAFAATAGSVSKTNHYTY